MSRIAAFAAPVALVALLLVVLVIPRDGGGPAEGALTTPSEEQATAINRLVEALRTRDAAALISVFAADATFNPRGDFQASSCLFGNCLPVADVELVERWLLIVRAWGLEPDVRGCTSVAERAWHSDPSDQVVRCAVAASWQTLSLEVAESWRFEFDRGRIRHWGFDLVDLNPDPRSLPLGYDGIEAWERWLTAKDPTTAARILNQSQLTGWENDSDWVIGGRRFAPSSYIPYDPAYAAEIEASISEFVREQDAGR